MRVPTSVIVMGLVTAVPFGLAINDTVHHKTAATGGDLDLTGERRARAERLASIEQAEREQQARIAAQKKRAEDFIASLFGPTPGSMGTLLDGISLGANADAFMNEPAQKRIYDTGDLADVTYDTDQVLRAVHVHLRSASCDGLPDKLLAAWGHSVGSVWLDPANHRRASLDGDSFCTLTFDQVIEPEAWVAALPLDKIGSAASSDETTWHLPGIGYGRRDTVVMAYARGTSLAGVNVISDTDFDTQLRIRDLLSAKLGKQPVQDDNDNRVWTWKTKPPVTLDSSGAARFSVQIGAVPWQ